MFDLQIFSMYDEAFRTYGCAWADVPVALTAPIVAAHAESEAAVQGAHVGLGDESIDIANMGQEGQSLLPHLGHNAV